MKPGRGRDVVRDAPEHPSSQCLRTSQRLTSSDNSMAMAMPVQAVPGMTVGVQVPAGCVGGVLDCLLFCVFKD